MTEPTLIPFDDWQGSPSEQVAKLRAELAAEQRAHAETREKLKREIEQERMCAGEAIRRYQDRAAKCAELQTRITELEQAWKDQAAM
jgi:hypothetical protein